MKMKKRLMLALALNMGIYSSISMVYAQEKNVDLPIESVAYVLSAPQNRTTAVDVEPPSLFLSVSKIDGKTYLIIESVDNSGERPTIWVNDSTNGVEYYDQYRVRYEIKRSGRYKVEARDRRNNSKVDERYISVDGVDSKLSLSKKVSGNNCYLVIEAYAYNKISNLTVNGLTIPFDENGEKYEYRVRESGTYTVKMTDKEGVVKTESLYINVNSNEPTLKLSKTYKNNKWYLVIEAKADNKIKTVKVNGKSISFNSNGGTEEYEVTQSDTYKVVVTDSDNQTASDSIKINIDENTKIAPTVTVTREKRNDGWYLVIKATDDQSISKMTVNGSTIEFNTKTGIGEYKVPVDGNYKIAVTDNDGNVTHETVYALSGNTATTNPSKKIIFKLGSKAWTKDGVSQPLMDVGPQNLHSRVYLPIRYVAYALDINEGAINWDAKTKTVTITDKSNVVKLQLGSKVMYVNNQAVTMDVAPEQISGRVILPISQVTKAFSYKNVSLDWDNQMKQLTIVTSS